MQKNIELSGTAPLMIQNIIIEKSIMEKHPHYDSKATNIEKEIFLMVKIRRNRNNTLSKSKNNKEQGSFRQVGKIHHFLRKNIHHKKSCDITEKKGNRRQNKAKMIIKRNGKEDQNSFQKEIPKISTQHEYP